MCVDKNLDSRLDLRSALKHQQKGWLLLVVIMVLMFISVGAVMLMSQAQLGLKSVKQEHQAIQEKINQWPQVLGPVVDVDVH